MNGTKKIYTHESDASIMAKKDKAEVVNWAEALSYVNEELEYLLNIGDRMLHNRELYQQLLSLRSDNTLHLATLHRYESSLGKAIECDTVACDAYYLHHHEKNRNVYIDHLKNYRTIKTRVFSKILSKVDTQ